MQRLRRLDVVVRVWRGVDYGQSAQRRDSGLVTLGRLEESVTPSIEYADESRSATNALHFQSHSSARVGLGTERMSRTTSYVTERAGPSLEREGDVE